MKIENEELLLKDICGRLLHGVKCLDIRHGDSVITSIDIEDKTVYCFDFDEWVNISDIKPYLRTISSMTKEEFDKFEELEWSGDFEHLSLPLLDWLNKKMFDYRGLIPIGLALEATKNMYNINDNL